MDSNPPVCTICGRYAFTQPRSPEALHIQSFLDGYRTSEQEFEEALEQSYTNGFRAGQRRGWLQAFLVWALMSVVFTAIAGVVLLWIWRH